MRSGTRRVVLGISGHRTAHLIERAASWWLDPGDEVRVVHAYQAIPYVAVDWQLPIDNDALVREATERHVREAVAKLRRSRPDVLVSAELTGSPAAVALAEAARTADLVLAGVPHADRSRAVLATLLGAVGCPAVLIGATEPATPTTAVAAILRGNDTDQAVLAAAFAQARRLRCALLAVKSWQPPLDGNLRFAQAAEQRILDGHLAGWQQGFPDVSVSSTLRAGEPLGSLVDQLASTVLLVLGLPGPGAADDQLDPLLEVSISAHTHCSMLVPAADRAVGRSPDERQAAATSLVRSASRLV